MKKLAIILVLAVVALFPCFAAAADLDQGYRLLPGDAVLISVWREDALNREVQVLPDGSISFPLSGRLLVAGLTVPEVEARVAEKLKQYISDPVVTAVVTGIGGNKVYVLGKVINPGPVVLSGPMTALQAISLAGGLNTFADGNAIRVLRPGGERNQLFRVRYNDLMHGRNLETNIKLMAGDTILVP